MRALEVHDDIELPRLAVVVHAVVAHEVLGRVDPRAEGEALELHAAAGVFEVGFVAHLCLGGGDLGVAGDGKLKGKDWS